MYSYLISRKNLMKIAKLLFVCLFITLTWTPTKVAKAQGFIVPRYTPPPVYVPPVPIPVPLPSQGIDIGIGIDDDDSKSYTSSTRGSTTSSFSQNIKKRKPVSHSQSQTHTRKKKNVTGGSGGKYPKIVFVANIDTPDEDDSKTENVTESTTSDPTESEGMHWGWWVLIVLWGICTVGGLLNL
jgi:hypothetical protein